MSIFLDRTGSILNMAVCMRCNATLSFLENITHFSRLKFCSNCEKQMNGPLGRLQQQIMQEAAQGKVTEQFSAYVYQALTANRIPQEYAASLLQLLGHQKHLSDLRQINSILERLRQQIMQEAAQSRVTEQFCAYVYQELAANSIPQEHAKPLLHLLGYQKHLSDIRQGHLPMIRVNAILDTDEQAHFETMATYHKPNKQIKLIQGSLIATNKKLYFITPDRDSMKLDWNNVVNVNESFSTSTEGESTGLMHIQVSKGCGGGYYHVPDPTLTAAIVDTAVRIWKRHLVELKENSNIQGIPEHVKVVVFQRDGGRCRQCGYTGPYIEYDHIMPRSKAGPNTVGNIQLLCRQCNQRKGDRVQALDHSHS